MTGASMTLQEKRINTMAKLILTFEGAVIREYPLDQERMTVGRKAHNAIQLEDPTVSGEHAAFLVLEHVYVEDLGSTNGIILNGKKVTKRQLEHGDIVRIGHHELKFVDQNTQDFVSTVMIPPDKVTSDSAPVPKNPVVSILSGPKSGDVIKLNKPYTTLGSPGGQVAVIARRGTTYFIMPMSGIGDAAQNPLLNSVPIGAKSQPLKEGDTIEVAGTKLQFSLNG